MDTNLKAIRKAAGWSNADDFAEFIGIPAKTYRNYEQGIRGLNLDIACDICNALGCSLNDLVPLCSEVDEHAEETDVPLTSDERHLVELYRSLSPDYRDMLTRTAVAYSEMTKKDGACDCVDVGRAGIAVS